MKRHLNICIQIEEAAARIYREMIKSGQLSTAVHQTLTQLAEDEDEHATQLRFALRFPEGSLVNSSEQMLAQARALLQEAEQLLEKVSSLSVDDRLAIKLGIRLEESFCKVHIANSFEFSDPTYKTMFAAMAKADEEHCRRLVELQSTLS